MQAMADIDTSKITPLRPFTDEEALAWLRERGKLTIAGAQLARQWGWGERKAQRKLDDWKSDGLIKRSGKQITALGTAVLPKPDMSVLAKSDTKSDMTILPSERGFQVQGHQISLPSAKPPAAAWRFQVVRPDPGKPEEDRSRSRLAVL